MRDRKCVEIYLLSIKDGLDDFAA